MSKKPFVAPTPAYGERDYRFLQRLAKEFEDWVNQSGEPAVDPDLIEARKVAAACPHVPDVLAAYISAGERDADNTVRGALAGIKKGRELALGELSPLDDRL